MVKQARAKCMRKPSHRRNDRPTGAGVSIDWRTVETELKTIARTYGFSLERNGSSDIIVDQGTRCMECGEDNRLPEINLTETAKELAERLGSKA